MTIDEQLVWEVAKAIHNTDDMADTSWPESEDDDGNRGGDAYLRLCQEPELTMFRDAARAAIHVCKGRV